jgi:hypothetical protein
MPQNTISLKDLFPTEQNNLRVVGIIEGAKKVQNLQEKIDK